MHENMYRVESAVTATASGELTWERWPHDVATALGLAGQRNPLGFALVRYLSDSTNSGNTIELVLHLASALVGSGLDGAAANKVAWKAIEAWNTIRCPACFGCGVLNIQQQVCQACNGTGDRDITQLPAPVRDGITALIEAERWIEGQLAARLKR